MNLFLHPIFFSLLHLSQAVRAAEVEPIDPEAALVLYEEQLRWVERDTGRRFVERPPIRFLSLREAVALIEADALSALEQEGKPIDGAVRVRVREEAVEVAMDELGFYSRVDQTVYIQREGLDGIRRDYRIDQELRDAIVRCVITHELVHALQDQNVVEPTLATDEERLGHGALIEGQAVLVEEHLCDSNAKRFLDTLQGTDVLASFSDKSDDLVRYGLGRYHVAAIEERWGDEGVWWALSQPPPSREQLELAGRAKMLRGWNNPHIVSDPAHDIVDLEGWTYFVGPMSPVRLLTPATNGGMDFTDAPKAQAGLGFHAGFGTWRIVVVAFALSDPQEPVAWMEARRDAARHVRLRKGGEFRVIANFHTWQRHFRVGRLPFLAHRYSPTDTLKLAVPYWHGGYREHWVTSGGLMVGVAVRHPHVTGWAVNRAIRAILDRHLPTTPWTGDVSGLQEILMAAAPPADAAPRPSWQFFARKARIAAGVGDRASCLEAIEAGLEALGPLPVLEEVRPECEVLDH